MTKTAAGTATPILTLRIGHSGRRRMRRFGAATFAAGTAAADVGVFYIDAIFRTVAAARQRSSRACSA